MSSKLIYLILALSFCPVILSAQNQFSDTLSVTLLNDSELTIYGTTNINSFDCKLDQDFETDTLDVPATRNESHIKLENAVIRVETDAFNCGAKKITKDFKKTLKSKDHPFIYLDYSDIRYNTNTSDPEQLDIRANVSITIADIKQNYDVQFEYLTLIGDVLSFKGKQKVDMKSFDLDPPKAMMGLIKVNKEVEVEFYLYMRFVDA